MRFLGAFLLGLIMVGCGSSGPTTSPGSTAPTPSTTTASSVYVPPGVDSSTAQRADSMARNSFVSLEKQEEAASRIQDGRSLVQISDSLWKYLEMGNDTTNIDSVSQKKRAAAIRSYNRGADSLSKYVKVTKASELDSTKLVQLQANLLEGAQKAFEEAIKLNPYDDATRNRLAQVYQLQATRLKRQEAHQKAVKIYEKLTRLRKDQPAPFLNLANSYYQTEQYGQAAENYSKARETYLESIELSLSENSQVDSTQVYQYALAEADAYRFAREAEKALETYRLAKSYANTSSQEETTESWIEWVNWDDGNIAASFARDSLATLATQGKFEAAVQGFRQLKPELNTQSARDEIDWRLAQSEYQIGDRERAADRLQALFRRTEKGPNGAPADSTYQKYFDTYGTICLNLGRNKRGEDLRTALKYFQQSAEVKWSRQPLAELEAGKLLRNNVEKSIEYLERAVEEKSALNVKDRLQLYRNLVRQHRRLGHRDEAMKYREMFQRLRKKSATS